MFKQFLAMWNGRLRWIDEAKHWINLLKGTVGFAQSDLFLAGTKVWELKKMGIDQMFERKVTKRAQTELATQKVFEYRKDVKLYLCLNYWRLYAFGKLILCPIPRTIESDNFFVEDSVFCTQWRLLMSRDRRERLLQYSIFIVPLITSVYLYAFRT